MRTITFILAALLAAVAPAHAAEKLIAGYVYYVTADKDALIIELSDAEAKPNICQGIPGLHVAQLLATNNAMYPSAIPYGRGCWFAEGQNIHISFVRLQDGEGLGMTHPKSKFIKTRNFTSWFDVAP